MIKEISELLKGMGITMRHLFNAASYHPIP